MAISRRSFLGGLGAAAAGGVLAPLMRVRPAFGAGDFATRHVVIVGIGGGLRNSEALGMAEGATMPNLFGDIPLIPGYGDLSAGPTRIAPEYDALVQPLVLPSVRPVPLYTEGALITNLRYAEGVPGHLQGQGCLVSGYYNSLENRADARLEVPTIFELHRRQTDAPATDAWYVSVPGGFYRALQNSAHPEFGARFGGSFLSPPGVASAIVPIVTSGRRAIAVDGTEPLPIIPENPGEDAAVRRLVGVLDGNTPPYPDDDGVFRASVEDSAQFQSHLASIYGDNTYASFFPDSFGIGLDDGGGGLNPTGDAQTTYHAEQILARFKPSVMAITLVDVDAAHNDFNGYLRGQQVADACVSHLWNFIQSTEGLRDETTMIVLPEHGRHLFFNGQNPDSLGRSGLDHGQGDDGDRDVFMLALGPDIEPGAVLAPTGVTQPGRPTDRYESIDAIMTAMTFLGHGDVMAQTLSDQGARPGLMIGEVCR